MFTGSVLNNSLIIYSTDTVTGVNTNYLFVFDDNVFKTISTYNIDSKKINITLLDSVNLSSNIRINLYSGGITTTSASLTTTFNVINNTIFLDSTAPSLFEMIEQSNYNFTSYVYSNYITGITTQANFPSANIILKRNPPIGKITINEGFLGSMSVHRFVGLSSSIFTINESDNIFNTLKSFAFDYNAYGDQLIKSIKFSLGAINTFGSNAKAFITINEDYFDEPSPIIVGVSSVVDFSNQPAFSFRSANFSFSTSVLLQQQKYWIIFTPTPDSSFEDGNIIRLKESIANNYYTSLFYKSSDSVVFSSESRNGLGMTIFSERGIVLPSIDAIFNQLDEPQAIEVEYGDSSNMNLYTQLAVPNTSHYIKKNFVDNSLVYAVETLITSLGQNQYNVTASIGAASTIYYSMIANALTTNIERFELYTPINLTNLKLISMGDYYAQSPIGNVLVSAFDFLGIATVEISSSALFPDSATEIIEFTNPPQKYIDNISYDFGDLGKKFSEIINNIGSSIKFLYIVNISGDRQYLLISDDSVYLYDGLDTITLIKLLSASKFTTSVIAASGIVIADTLGNIYNFSAGVFTTIGSISPTPLSSATLLSSTYIGVGTRYDSNKVSNRKRIYLLNNGAFTHQFWSTQIPEPQITLIYATSSGIIIGAYDQNNLIGKIYVYYNTHLTQLYSTYLRPDAAYFSQSSSTLYVGFSGDQILSSKLSNNKWSRFIDNGINVSGNIIKEINSTRVANKIFVVTDTHSYIFDELTFVTTLIKTPGYSIGDQHGLLITVEDLNNGLINYESSYLNESYSALNFDPTLNGFNSTYRFKADGFIVFNGVSSLGYSTNFYLQIPDNATLESLKLDNKSLSTTAFSGIFYSSIPKSFSVSIIGNAAVGIATIALYNGINSSMAPILGATNLTPPKTLNWYLKSGGKNDLFAFADGSIREADMSELTANQYTVYARFTDIVGNVSAGDNVASDIIYNQIQQQINGQALPTGRIVQIDENDDITSFVPADGANSRIYAGSKIVRQSGIFESDPFFASDVTSWDLIQVLALIPASTPEDSFSEHGTSVTLYVKTSSSLLNLSEIEYINSYTLTTINNGNDYSASYASILANISSLSGQWLQFKIVLTTATINIGPTVKSVLITYNGAGKSVFITKTYDTAVQSSISPTPKIRRGILTANFVANGGIVSFAYTTNPDDNNPNNYNEIIPNQIFTLSTPSEKIKFGVILKTATSTPCFFDEFGVQLDLGPDDLYFMPPQAAFEIAQYYNSSGVAVTHAYQFVNKSVGIVSSYNWSFGTSSLGITTYYPPDEDGLLGPAIHRQNPIIGFSNTGPFIVGLFITGWVENNVFFNSEIYTKTFIAT